MLDDFIEGAQLQREFEDKRDDARTNGGQSWSTTGSLPSSDTSSPDTAITSVRDGGEAPLANDAVTLSTSVTVSFTGTDNVALSQFECQLDGGGFSACVSPRAYNALLLGRHTFEVRAVDTSNNVDPTPARHSWTVAAPAPPADTAPPETSITSAADGSGAALANNAVTLSSSLTLTFTGTDNVGLSRFECQLDGGGFSACASPRAYNGLPLGRHTFEVRAVDTSNNVDTTPARYSWTVDTPPDTTITSAIDGRGKSITNGGTTPSNSMTFRFTGTDNGTVARFECGLDTAAFASCTSPVTYGTVNRGTHTFRVRAIDNNGFADPSPAVFNWTR